MASRSAHFRLSDTRIIPAISRTILSALLCCAIGRGASGQQIADSSFVPDVHRPAYTSRGPTVLFDHAHRNFHRADGNYRAFAGLIARDGYRITVNQSAFSRESLQGFDILVIVNARGGEGPAAFDTPAFTSDERVSRVLTFTGQSLSVPPGATALWTLSPTAMDGAPQTRAQAQALEERVARLRDSVRAARAAAPLAQDTAIALRLGPRDQPATRQLTSAAGRAQGISLEAGKGRVVILGEAACLSAQIIAIPGMPPRKMGMNVPGTDNQKFGLNVMRWLSRLL